MIEIPHDIPAEVCTLAAMILDPKALTIVDSICTAESFHRPAHQIIFAAISEMHQKGYPVDLVLLSDELKRSGKLEEIGGVAYLLQIAEGCPDTANVKHYARIVTEKHRLRLLITNGQAQIRDACEIDADPLKIVEQAQAELYHIGRGTGSVTEVVTAKDSVAEAIAKADRIAAGQESPGLMTAFAGIDQALGGFQPGDLITVGAGPGVGKSSFAMTIAARVAAGGGGVFFVSAEMSRVACANRLLQVVSGIAGGRLRNGNLDQWEDQARSEAQQQIAGWNFSIWDTSATVADIASRCKMESARTRRKWDLIVIDYLQLLKPGKGDTRAQEVSAVAWGLKLLAMELGCPVMMLSQLNRGGLRQDTAVEKPPSLYDLKESGDIENHSNAVILLHRPATATPDTAGAIPIWCKIAKARDGSITPWPAPAGKQEVPGAITLRFTGHLTRFE